MISLGTSNAVILPIVRSPGTAMERKNSRFSFALETPRTNPYKWATVLDSGGSVRTVFVDFQKAFDRVDNNIVLHKLLQRDVPHFMIKWMFSCLEGRQQRVKVNDGFSNWTQLVGGMPQDSWLRPLIFLLVIDDLQLDCLVHKFVDVTTLSELLDNGDHASNMTQYVESLSTWAQTNKMIINRSKSKEMILGSLAKQSILFLTVQSDVIERVTTFKLLGVTLTNDLSWEAHVNSICAKVAPRLYYLTQLRRAGLSSDELSYFYLMVFRPVLKYGCAVWHHGLTVAQSQKLESLQKRALRIIHQIAYGMPYESECANAWVQFLSVRRHELGKRFFFARLRNQTVVYMTFFPNDETHIIFRLRRHRLSYTMDQN